MRRWRSRRRVEKCVVFNRCNTAVEMKAGRDVWWHDVDGRAPAPTAPPSRSTANIRCSSSTRRGSTGKPKGVLHTTAGYLLGTSLTHKWVFDLKEDDVYWCTADVGWVTGHSYIVYGPLANGATMVMYEGAPNHPKEDRFWEIIEKYSVTIFYTAPTAIRAFIKWGDQRPKGHDLSQPAPARHRRRADQPRSVDVVPRGHRRRALPDRRHVVADRNRRDHDRAAARRDRRRSPAARPSRCRASWPRSSTRRATRCRANAGRLPRREAAVAEHAADDLRRRRALSRRRTGANSPACYFTADGARTDDDGYFWIMGRVDDVLNVARPSPEHDGGRERPGAPPEGRRGGGRRPAGRDQGRRHLLLRDAEAGRRRRPTS